jgi:hypothetical protein
MVGVAGVTLYVHGWGFGFGVEQRWRDSGSKVSIWIQNTTAVGQMNGRWLGCTGLSGGSGRNKGGHRQGRDWIHAEARAGECWDMGTAGTGGDMRGQWVDGGC